MLNITFQIESWRRPLSLAYLAVFFRCYRPQTRHQFRYGTELIPHMTEVSIAGISPIQVVACYNNDRFSDWPPFPWLHYILLPSHPLEDPQWMYFISEGTPFTTTESTALDWQIGSVLMRLADLEDEDPCPPFYVHTGDLHTTLHVAKYPPTVQLCRRAVATVDKQLDKWGAKEIQVYIGEGDPRESESTRGLLELGLGHDPPVNEV